MSVRLTSVLRVLLGSTVAVSAVACSAGGTETPPDDVPVDAGRAQVDAAIFSPSDAGMGVDAGCVASACPRVAHGASSCFAGACDVDCEPGYVRDATGLGCSELVHHIAAGDTYACAIRADGSLTCWGKPLFSAIATPPSGTFRDVSVSTTVACAVRTNGGVVCWDGTVRSPSGLFLHVAAGQNRACGLRTDGTIACWAANASVLASAGLDAVPSGTFRQVVLGNYAAAVRADGTAVRWGSAISSRQNDLPAADNRVLSMAHFANGVGAALGKDRALHFWGSYGGFESHPVGFRTVGMGSFNACTILLDGELACVKEPNGPLDPSVPRGKFREVAAFNNFACAIHVDGHVACWGKNDVGQASPPSGVF